MARRPARAAEHGTCACIIGEPRSLTVPCVHRTLRARFLEVLAARGPLSVAILLKRANATSSGIAWTQGAAPSTELLQMGEPSTTYKAYRAPPSDVAIQRALQHLRSTAGLEQLDMRWLPDWSEQPACGRDMPPCVLSGAASPTTERFLAQQRNFEACLAAVEEREAVRGARFEMVVRTRPDLWWQNTALPDLRGVFMPARYDKYRSACERAQPFTLTKPYLAVSDWLVATPRRLAHAALGYMRDLCTECTSRLPHAGSWALEPPPAPQHILTTEGLLAARLGALSNLTTAPLRASVVRDWDGAFAAQRRVRVRGGAYACEAARAQYPRVRRTCACAEWRRCRACACAAQPNGTAASRGMAGSGFTSAKRAAGRADVLAMTRFARWSGVPCTELDRECFRGKLRSSGLGWCTASAHAHALHIDRWIDGGCAERNNSADNARSLVRLTARSLPRRSVAG
jgi:hypothetical protein